MNHTYEPHPADVAHFKALDVQAAFEDDRDRRIKEIEALPFIPDDIYEACDHLCWAENEIQRATLTGLVNAKDADGLLAMVERLLSERRSSRATDAVIDQMSAEETALNETHEEVSE